VLSILPLLSACSALPWSRQSPEESVTARRSRLPATAPETVLTSQQAEGQKSKLSESYGARGMALIAAFAGRDASRNDERKPPQGARSVDTRLELSPGKHRLQLALGDSKYYLFAPPIVSKTITIEIIRQTSSRHRDR
jgi:Domain of unknown function (DUF4399)